MRTTIKHCAMDADKSGVRSRTFRRAAVFIREVGPGAINWRERHCNIIVADTVTESYVSIDANHVSDKGAGAGVYMYHDPQFTH